MNVDAIADLEAGCIRQLDASAFFLRRADGGEEQCNRGDED